MQDLHPFAARRNPRSFQVAEEQKLQEEPGIDPERSSPEKWDNHGSPVETHLRTQGTDLRDRRTSACNRSVHRGWSGSRYKPDSLGAQQQRNWHNAAGHLEPCCPKQQRYPASLPVEGRSYLELRVLLPRTRLPRGAFPDSTGADPPRPPRIEPSRFGKSWARRSGWVTRSAEPIVA